MNDESLAISNNTPQQGRLTFVLITPARNEADYIQLTLESVVRQTHRPLKWVIVSDGSTDGTDDMVSKYTAEHEWIELVRMPERKERHFAAKVHAFNAGYERVKGLAYDVIANLDADISFGEDLFEFLVGKFAEHPSLGVAGTAFIEGSSLKYDYSVVSLDDVQGQCQFFRRACFEEIGGYIPIKNGGIDVVPVYLARMRGWMTRTFIEKIYTHHRLGGTALGSIYGSFFKSGKKDYYLGGHPLWEIFRCLYQMKRRPYIVGGLLLFSGYVWQLLSGSETRIPAELVAFRRKEQLQRLNIMFRNVIAFRKFSERSDGSAVDSVKI